MTDRSGGGRNAWLVAAVVATILIVPTVHAADAEVDRIEGTAPIVARTTDAQLLFRPGDALDGRVAVDASWMTAVVRDDISQTVQVPRPGDEPFQVFGKSEKAWDNSTHLDSRLVVRSLVEPDATILVKPLSEDFSVVADHDGRFVVDRVDDEVLEQSHLVEDNHTENQEYYEYRVRDTLNLTLDGDTTYDVEGDFLVYVWGATFTVDGDDARRVRTGHHVEDNTADADVHREDHYVHAKVHVRDGHLTLATADQRSRLYGDRIEADVDAPARAPGAPAALPGADPADGVARLPGGTYRWSSGSGTGVAVDAPETAGSKVPSVLAADPTPLALAGVLAVAAGAYTYPNAYARWTRKPGRDPPEGGWRARRAEGYLRLGLRAHGRGRRRLAQLLLDRAVRLTPDQPDLYATRAIVRRDAGRTGAALADHRRAHERLGSYEDEAALAQNAFQAARTAARAGRGDDARSWIRLAAEREPAVLDMALDEPDLASVLPGARDGSPDRTPTDGGPEVA